MKRGWVGKTDDGVYVFVMNSNPTRYKVRIGKLIDRYTEDQTPSKAYLFSGEICWIDKTKVKRVSQRRYERTPL